MNQPRHPAGADDGGRFAPRERPEAAVSLTDVTDATPETEPRFVKPVTCRRCSGTGEVASRVVHAGVPGTCFTCTGFGMVEGDPATKRAAKARKAAQQAIITTAIAEAVRRGLPHHTATALSYGIDHLHTHHPERYEKALDSHLSGHPGLFKALVVYTAEAGYFHYGATQQSPEQMLERLDLE